MSTIERYALLVLLPLAVARCGNDADRGSIRVFNAVAFSFDTSLAPQTTDLYIDDGDAPWVANLEFGAATDAIHVAAGKHRIIAVQAGASRDAVLAEIDEVAIADGEPHALVLTAITDDLGDDDDSNDLLESFIVLDREFGAADPGTARVRFVGAVGFDIQYLNSSIADVSVDVGRDGVDNTFAVGGQSDGDTAVRAGVATEYVVTLASGVEAGAYDVPALEDGRDYYAVVCGSAFLLTPKSPGFVLALIPNDGGEVIVTQAEPALYVLNAELGGATYQLAIDGAVVANAVAYKDLVGPLRRKSGQVTLLANGVVVSEISTFDALEGGSSNLVVIAGKTQPDAVDQPELTLLKPPPGDFGGSISTTLRAVNAADVPQLDFAVQSTGNVETPFGSAVDFGVSTPPPGVNVSVLGDMVVRRTDSMTTLAELDRDDAADGVFDILGIDAYVVAVGSPRGGALHPVELVLVKANLTQWLSAESN